MPVDKMTPPIMTRADMLRMGVVTTDDTSWQPESTYDLMQAIARLENELPGWWWSVGACHVSSDASIAPDRKGPAADLLIEKIFDDGFHYDLQRPSSCADALNACIDDALAVLAKYRSRSLAVKAASS